MLQYAHVTESDKVYDENMLIGDEIFSPESNNKYLSTVTAKAATTCLKISLSEVKAELQQE